MATKYLVSRLPPYDTYVYKSDPDGLYSYNPHTQEWRRSRSSRETPPGIRFTTECLCELLEHLKEPRYEHCMMAHAIYHQFLKRL